MSTGRRPPSRRPASWSRRCRGSSGSTAGPSCVKFGGNAMTDEALQAAFAEDVVFLRYAGLRPVVVHGGGPQITAHARAARHRRACSACGHRVTTPEAMDVVRMVLVGQVQREIVGLVNAHGPFAVGLSGEDANLFTAEPRRLEVDGEPVDLGLVGDVVDGRPRRRAGPGRRRPDPGRVAASRRGTRRRGLQRQRRHRRRRARGGAAAPRSSSCSPTSRASTPTGRDGPARTTTSSAASPPTSSRRCCPRLSTRDGARRWRPACGPCAAGVPKAHVIDGRVPHALLVEVFTDEGVGTEVHRHERAVACGRRWPASRDVPSYGDAAADAWCAARARRSGTTTATPTSTWSPASPSTRSATRTRRSSRRCRRQVATLGHTSNLVANEPSLRLAERLLGPDRSRRAGVLRATPAPRPTRRRSRWPGAPAGRRSSPPRARSTAARWARSP